MVGKEEIELGNCEKTKLQNKYVGKRKGFMLTWKL